MKLSKKQLSAIIESIMSERFGAYDREDRVNIGPPDVNDPDDDVMMPHHFENAAVERFSTALDPVIDEFVDSHFDVVTHGTSPGADDDVYHTELVNLGEELKEDLLTVIGEYSAKVRDMM